MACNRFPWICTHNAYLHSMKSSMYILPYGRRFWMPFPDCQLAVNGANSSWHIAAQSGCQQPFVASFEVIKSKYALWQRSLLSGKLQRVHTTKSISIFIITDLYAYIFYIYFFSICFRKTPQFRTIYPVGVQQNAISLMSRLWRIMYYE